MNLSRFSSLLVAALVAVLALPAAAQQVTRPPRPVPPACGIKSLPLAVGNTWTYKSGDKQLTVRVEEITPAKTASGQAMSRIKVLEEYAGRSLRVEWTCTAREGITMTPESFFFTGEPGGGVGTAFTYTAHEGVTYGNDGSLVRDTGWVEKVKADAVRADTSGQGVSHPPTKLEMERHILIHPTTPLETPLGKLAAIKVAFDLRGRGILDAETVEIPIQRPGAIYLVKGLGVVRIEDPFKSTWDLVSTNLPIPTR